MNSGLSHELQAFICQHIHSVEQLEVLLLLKRSDAREWTADEVTREMASHRHAVESRLLDLSARGFLKSRTEGSELFYSYDQSSPLERLVEGLAAAYAERRVTVITAIFAEPKDSLRHFADAFKLRKGEDP